MPKKPKRVIVDEFVKQSSDCGEVRLVAGIDKKPKDPHPNAIFYIRMESQDRETGDSCKTEDIWLTLSEMTRLSVLMSIASQFWIERLEKGEPYSEERIKIFQKEYKRIKESLNNILP